MYNMTVEEFRTKIREYGTREIPFIFVIDFEMKKPFVCKLNEAPKNNVYYDIKGKTNFSRTKVFKRIKVFTKYPIQKEKYLEAFKLVKEYINRGDTYLLNLTFKTRVETDCTLQELFYFSEAPYKLFFNDEFIVFSPECFIKIKDNQIFSYPMKGTIDAGIPDAEDKILNNKKELYEHNTIVDLIRNDLSIISENVEVTKFRYIDKIKTNQTDLLQVSSEIRGRLPEDWKTQLDEILIKMLPAGSISGAPKQKTLEIIRKAEKEERGYYTGIFGIFDGKSIDSAVCIRYIESTKNGLQFRSGGGITALSNPDSEYQEMIDKVYVPIS